MVDAEFPKQARLLRSPQFRHVYELKQSVSDALLIVYGRENDVGRARLGLTVSRKIGQAVVRNRWKRLIREAFRLSQDRLPDDIDLVVTPRIGADPEFHAIMQSLNKLAWAVRKKLRHRRKVE